VLATILPFLDQASSPELWVFIEVKAFGSSIWSIYNNMASKINATADNTFLTNLFGSFYFSAGDTFRIKIIKTSTGWSAVLGSSPKTIQGVTCTNYPAILFIHKA